jgi:uncharacterized protein YggL (DUF469 family)
VAAQAKLRKPLVWLEWQDFGKQVGVRIHSATGKAKTENKSMTKRIDHNPVPNHQTMNSSAFGGAECWMLEKRIYSYGV